MLSFLLISAIFLWQEDSKYVMSFYMSSETL